MGKACNSFAQAELICSDKFNSPAKTKSGSDAPAVGIKVHTISNHNIGTPVETNG
jgi:hypothetical protein